jgi:hypothetical protein
MELKGPILCLIIGLLPAGTYLASAQSLTLPDPKDGHKRMFTVRTSPETKSKFQAQVTAGATLPLWSYSIVSPLDGQTYQGAMVGRDPSAHGHRTTTIPTYVVPLSIAFPGGDTFNPTDTNNSCEYANTSVMTLVENSPIFQSVNWPMNGIAMGNTQYIDAFQRESFWKYVAGTPYHTLLGMNILPTINVTVPAGQGQANAGYCHDYGVMSIDWFDNYLQTTILPDLQQQYGVGPSALPMLVLDSVFEYQGTPNQCCVLGYHGSFYNNSNTLVTYNITSYDTSDAFGGDISVTTHEVGEWMDDPSGANPTPAWGHIGQVGGCQNNLEVGDPLTGTLWGSATINGITYHPQELASFSWY